MRATIRTLIAEHGRLAMPINSLVDDQDLYAAGLTSFAAVQLMLALECEFAVVFPDALLKRRSFASIDAITGCVRELATSTAA